MANSKLFAAIYRCQGIYRVRKCDRLAAVDNTFRSGKVIRSCLILSSSYAYQSIEARILLVRTTNQIHAMSLSQGHECVLTCTVLPSIETFARLARDAAHY